MPVTSDVGTARNRPQEQIEKGLNSIDALSQSDTFKTMTNHKQLAAIRNNNTPQRPPSLVDRFKQGTHRRPQAGLSKIPGRIRNRQDFSTPVQAPGTGLSLQVDDGRVSFTIAARRFGWEEGTLLETFSEGGRLYVTEAVGSASRGVISRLGKALRFTMPAAMRAAIGVADNAHVFVVLDDARQAAVIESSVHLIARAYPDLYEALTGVADSEVA